MGTLHTLKPGGVAVAWGIVHFEGSFRAVQGSGRGSWTVLLLTTLCLEANGARI
jgi:hypothetical protein